jgi:hypothetical protein
MAEAPLAIRPVTAADVDPLAALQEASILRHGIAAYGLANARAWARVGHQFKRVLLEDGQFFVAERGGERLGVGGWSPDGMDAEVAWIRYLFVHPTTCGAASAAVWSRSPKPPRPAPAGTGSTSGPA